MKRLVVSIAAAALAAAIAAPTASAAFGLTEAEVSFNSEAGPETQAGAHPFSITSSFAFNTHFDSELGSEVPDGELRNLRILQAPGLVGDPTAVPRCPDAEFIAQSCPKASQVGVNDSSVGAPLAPDHEPVYNLVPPPGKLVRIGFKATGLVPVTVDVGLSPEAPYDVLATLANVPDVIPVGAGSVTLWGIPADAAHNSERTGTGVVSNSSPAPFLTLPRACTGPLSTLFEAESWEGAFSETSALSEGMTGCEKLGLKPTISAKPTTKAAASGTGLNFALDLQDEGLANPEGIAGSDLKQAVVTLPEGMTANPSQAEGLGVCTEAQLNRETAASAPGEGCPEASKIGNVEVESPLLQGDLLKGTLFIAKPYENPFDSLIALYLTIKDPEVGIGINLAGKVEPDPKTGQLITTFGDPSASNPAFRALPQLPFSHFRLHFREGARSPLISPPRCGAYEAKAVLTPWSGGAPVTTTSAFQIISGPSEAPCPGASAPFHPGFEAGSVSNNAGSYSPFDLRLTRKDGEQDMTKFSTVLPPGVLGKIAGLSRCSEAQIAQAQARTGPHGAQEELNSPSCPQSSKIGRTIAGAGVGSQLTFVPGSLYLAGPYHGDPLSVVSITPALAGPFDAGTVVVREALTLNPVSAEVEVDGQASDPIPHILKGIPLNVRDLRVYADRPDFTLNPTSCEPERTRATLWGGGTTFLPTAETPVGLSSPYQAANCASLGFRPKLQINLEGGTRRGSFPALKAIVIPREGDANFAKAIVTLPHSAFLEQGHFGTICTRVQFAAPPGNGAQCPAASIYGKATAWSPLLSEPAQGPVYLRSSDHNLPDLVLALRGPPSAPFDVVLASRIDSKEGGIRSSFEAIPDIPVSKFVLEMQGGKKGLIVNSTNLCTSTNRAKASITGQNGRLDRFSSVVKATGCAKHENKQKRRGSAGGHGRRAAH